MGEVRDNIARNIIMYRQQKKLTQKQLADLIESKPSTVSSWEQGASSPNSETLFKLCEIFGISISEMYGEQTSIFLEKYKDKLEDIDDWFIGSIEDQNAAELLHNFVGCNQLGRNLILDYSKFIAEQEKYKTE